MPNTDSLPYLLSGSPQLNNDHYSIHTGGASFSFQRTPTVSSGGDNQGTMIYSAAVVNGHWDGPYYFHYGSYTNTLGSTPWANNTLNAYPVFTDNFDTNTLFSYSQGNPVCECVGNITPVWFWDGPDLGCAPPSFPITVTTTAFARDYVGASSVNLVVDDAQGNSPISGPAGSKYVSDVGSYVTSVQSDSYEPDEGQGYWAIGPTFHLEADGILRQDTTEFPHYYTSVEMTAAMASSP